MSFPEAAAAALTDSQLRHNLAKATRTIRGRRQMVVAEVADWEELRSDGSAIREEALMSLDNQLTQLERSVVDSGGIVHWARDAAEANEIIVRLVQDAGADEVVKVKSLTTDEIELNDALAAAGIAALETDLAELIVQLADDRPSHILVPAIHRNRAEIRDLFEARLGERE